MRTFYWTVFPYSSKYSFELVFPSIALIRLSQNQTRYFSNCGMNSSVPPTTSHLGSRIHSSSSRRSPRTLNYPGSTLFCSSTSRSRISPSCPSRPVCGNGSPKLFVTDDLQGMPEANTKSFPESRRRLCLIHVQRGGIAQRHGEEEDEGEDPIQFGGFRADRPGEGLRRLQPQFEAG